MRIGVAARVGIGDGDATRLLPRTLQHAFIIILVVERVRHVAVAVRPAVDRDRSDVARAGKTSEAEHAVELVADSPLEVRKGHVEQPCPAEAKLRSRIEPPVGRARNVNEVEADRLGRIAWMLIAAEADGKIELDAAV